MTPCEYCGTPLDDNGEEESNIPAAGPRITHFAATCRERVFAAMKSYKRMLNSVVDDRTRALKRAYELTLDCQTCDEAVASLVEMVRVARAERDVAIGAAKDASFVAKELLVAKAT